MSKPSLCLPSGSGPSDRTQSGPAYDDAIVDQFITSYAGGDPRQAVDLLIKSNRDLMTELRGLRGAEPLSAEEPGAAADALDAGSDIDAAADMAIAACDGDMRAALKATLVVNAYLEREIDHIIDLVSPGFAGGKIRPAAG